MQNADDHDYLVWRSLCLLFEKNETRYTTFNRIFGTPTHQKCGEICMNFVFSFEMMVNIRRT